MCNVGRKRQRTTQYIPFQTYADNSITQLHDGASREMIGQSR